MAWIELHDTLPDHPKVIDLAELLRLDKDAVVGKLVRLWTWALGSREDGRLRRRDLQTLADVMRWKGKAQRLADALVEVRLLDPAEDGWVIHDWDEHVGIYLERKEAQKAYAKRKNALYGDLRLTKAVRERDGDTCQYCGKTVNWRDRRGCDGGTYDHIDPDGENSLENLCVACRSCNSSKRGRTPWEAGMPFIAKSALWQIYGEYSGRFLADKSSLKSAITVPKPYIDDLDPTTSILNARAQGEIHRLSTTDTTNCGKAVDNYGRELTPADAMILQGWEPHFDRDAIRYALDLADLYGAREPVQYASTVLAEWFRRGIRTEAEARAWREDRADDV